MDDLLSKIQTARTAIGFATIGGPAAAVIIIVFVAVFLIVMSTPGLSGQEAENIAAPSQPNIETVGNVVSINGATTQETQIVKGALSLGFSYPIYKKLLANAGPVTVVFESDPTSNGEHVHAKVLDADKITMKSGLSPDTLKYAFLHETGHIILFRNQDISGLHSGIYEQLLKDDLDLSCYKNGFLKSYPYVDGGFGAGGAAVESFAEAVSKFLISVSPYKPLELNDFRNECPSTYQWFLNNVFGS